MHELFTEILQRKSLSKSGEIFYLEDASVIQDIPDVVTIIQSIISQPSFLTNRNEQEIIEICITRITSAIRETRTIEQHAECLVRLLETCLGYNLRPVNGGPDPPHAKFASDVMPCIFLQNCSKRHVMHLALPVSVKFLHKGNKELSRNVASYLSMAAIENADLLAPHIQPIIDSVISGNYSLARVLPQIYSVNPDPIKNHVMTLVSILPNCENNDVTALLNLFSLIAKDSPSNLEPSVPQLCECLSSPAIAQDTLQVFYNMSLQRPHPLSDHTDQFRRAAEISPKSALLAIQLMTVIAKAKPEKSQETLDFILTEIGRMDSEKHSLVLKEVISLTSKYPQLLTLAVINRVSSLDEGGATLATKTCIQELKNEFNHLVSQQQLEKLTISTRYHPQTAFSVSGNNIKNSNSTNNYHIGSNSNAVTVVKVGGESARSELSLQSRPNWASTSSWAAPTTSTPSWSTSSWASTTTTATTTTAMPPIMAGSRHDIQGGTSGGSRDILFYTASSQRDISSNLNARDFLSNLPANFHLSSLANVQPNNRDVSSGIPTSSRDILLSTAGTSRDILSYTPTSSRDILSTYTNRDMSHSASIVARELSSSYGSRDILSAYGTSQDVASSNYVVSASTPGRDKSSATSRMPTHRSMTKLNSNVASSSGLDNKIGLHKSMTRLNNSQQNMARLSSSSQTVVVPSTTSRSITCITGSRAAPSVLSTPYHSSYTPHGQFTSARITVSSSGVGGMASPTKSMSSGSMSMDPNSCREVLTVNVNQINQDLIRQVSSVLSHHDIHNLLQPATSSNLQPTSSTHHMVSSAGPVSSIYNVQPSAPFSLPAHSSRRVGTYSSGPLPTASSSQPPSLGIPPTPAVVQPPTGPPLYPFTNYPEPPLKSSSHVSSQPLTSGSGGLSYPHSASTTRKNQRKNSTNGNNISRSGFSNTLPSPRRRQHLKDDVDNHDDNVEGDADALYKLVPPMRSDSDTIAAHKSNRASVFEPYPMRDTVQHFCEKHLDKIKSYMESLCVKLPLPVKCTIEERKGRKHAKLHFACQGRTGEHCLYKTTLYTMKTRNPRTWIHLMFLALQARSTAAISTRETSVSALKNCWEILKCEAISFVTLVTGAFPPAKAQDYLLHELRSHRFFDVFEYNGPLKLWGCFLCNHPDRATNFITEQEPVIEGTLKEKKSGKWKLFRRWKSRYFTLSGTRLTYKDMANGEPGSVTQSLDVGSIRSVKVTKEGRRNIPKAFEIFTNDKTFILKARDGSNAQEWVQCLSVAKAHNEAKDQSLRRLAHGGSLGRLHHQTRVPLHQHSNMALR